MSIIDNTYFINDITLTTGQLDHIQQWIDVYEPEFLKSLLGYDLYALLETDLNGTSDPTAQRFVDLVDGKAFSFELNGYTISTKWMGLRQSSLLKSIIADYVYFHYRNETESSNSGAGQINSLTENALRVDVRPKLINTWNKCIELYGKIPTEYINSTSFLNADNYVHYNIIPSAYNFLLANIDDYPEWVFEPLETLNIFGI